MNEQAKPQIKFYLDKEYIEAIERYGREHGIIATTGRSTGSVNRSEVVRIAIDKLTEATPAPAPTE